MELKVSLFWGKKKTMTEVNPQWNWKTLVAVDEAHLYVPSLILNAIERCRLAYIHPFFFAKLILNGIESYFAILYEHRNFHLLILNGIER